MTLAKLNGTWLRCGHCGHKLFKMEGGAEALPAIEIKCHSCKALNYTSANAQKAPRTDCTDVGIETIGCKEQTA